MSWLRERWLDLCAVPTAIVAIVGLALILPLMRRDGPLAGFLEAGDGQEPPAGG